MILGDQRPLTPLSSCAVVVSDGRLLTPLAAPAAQGPTGSGSPMHFHSDAVNTLVHGRKRWLLLRPARCFSSNGPAREWARRGATDDDCRATDDGLGLCGADESEEGTRAVAATGSATASAAVAAAAADAAGADGQAWARPMLCEQRAGDMFYAPRRWGHATLNCGESVGYAFELP